MTGTRTLTDTGVQTKSAPSTSDDRSTGVARTTLGGGDTFRTTSDAMPGVPANYLNAFKMQEVALANADGGSSPSLVLDRVLIDLSAADPALLDSGRIVRDCEYVRDLILRNPDAPRQIAAAFQPDADPADLLAAATMVKGIGLTEEQSLGAGGGLIFLAVALVGAVALGVVSVAVNYASGIKYKQAVARASSTDPNTGTISNQ